MVYGVIDSETSYPVADMTLPWVLQEIEEYKEIVAVGVLELTTFDKIRLAELEDKKRELRRLKN
jgi:hypothetical protein